MPPNARWPIGPAGSDRRRTYLTREAARLDVFEYIETFYNPKRKHTNNGMLSPVDFEARQQKLNEAGV
jgi:putative transposase